MKRLSLLPQGGLNDSLNSSAMKRRSLLPQVHGLNETLNTSIPIEDVDEEAERRGRVRIQRRQSLGPIRPGASTSSADNNSASTTSGYTPAQLAEHYANCMKLSAENKINVKNAFSLHMIDYMAEMVRKKAAGMDNFQAASCALDASAKIYGYRVDALHSDTLRLAGGVGKTVEEAGVVAGGASGEGNEDGPGVEGEDGAQKKVRKKRAAGATIEKNLNSINLSKFDLEFDVDPLFKKTSAQFDSGGGGGKFLCNLLTRDDSCKLLIDSKDIQFMPGEKSTAYTDANNNKFVWPKSNPAKLDDDSVTICPEFVTFKFIGWSAEDEELDASYLGSQQPPPLDDLGGDENNQEHIFDVHAPVDDDDQGFGGDFVGADDGMDNDEDVFFDDKREQFKGPTITKTGFTDVENLKRHLSFIPSEYSYFDSGRLLSWAGPQHWKFRHAKFPSTNVLPGGTAEKKSRTANKAKDPNPHSYKSLYTEEFYEENLTIDQIVKAMTVPKISVKLQPKTMELWSEDKILLPEDLHYSGKDFATLYHCDFHITTKPVKQMSVDDSVADYDFQNDNDVSNFCPEVNSAENGYEDEDAAGMADDPMTQSGVAGFNQSLVAAPNKVEKIQIGYAKQATKMDMRRLKAIEWELVSEFMTVHKDELEEQDNTNGSALDEDVEKEEKPIVQLSFGSLFKELHTCKKMPAQMTENLSVPLAFVALLHLCNENNLALKSMPDFSDFTIKQG